MRFIPYNIVSIDKIRIGLVVLQSDETIERDMMQMRGTADLFFSRVPSGQEVTAETLQSMAGHIEASAALFPQTLRFNAVGYGCTSGTAQIGVREIDRLVKSGTKNPSGQPARVGTGGRLPTPQAQAYCVFVSLLGRGQCQSATGFATKRCRNSSFRHLRRGGRVKGCAHFWRLHSKCGPSSAGRRRT